MDITKVFASVSSSSIQSSGCKGKTFDKTNVSTMEACLQKFAKGRREQLFVAKIHCHTLGNDDDLPHWQRGMLRVAGTIYHRIDKARTHFSVEAFYKDTGEYAFTLERAFGGISFSDDAEKGHIYASNVFVQKGFKFEDVIQFTLRELPSDYKLFFNNCKHFAYAFFAYMDERRPAEFSLGRFRQFCVDIEDQFAGHNALMQQECRQQ